METRRPPVPTRRNCRVNFKLKPIRKAQGMTLKQVANGLDLSESGLSDLERGVIDLPNTDTLVKMCDFLNLKSLSDLVELLPPNSQ